MIFQQFHLVPYLTALENVMLAQHYHSAVDKPQALRALSDQREDQPFGAFVSQAQHPQAWVETAG